MRNSRRKIFLQLLTLSSEADSHQPTTEDVLVFLGQKLSSKIQIMNEKLNQKSTFDEWDYEDPDEEGITDIVELEETSEVFLQK